MAPLTIPGLNLALTTGPLVLGFMWAYMLFGIFMCQTYLYYLHFPKDPTWIKRFVFLLFIVETLFMVFMTIGAWATFGPGFGDINVILFLHWSYVAMAPLNGLGACLVQSFFAWRIWKLGNNLIMPILIELLSLASLSFLLYYTAKTTMNGLSAEALFEQTPTISAWLACAMACDILITLTIVILLYRKGRETSYDSTTSLVTKLIRFTVETGCITSLAAIFELVSFLIAHRLSIHYIAYFILGKLYANTVLATLNSRALIFGDQSSRVPVNIRADSSSSAPTYSMHGVSSGARVHVHQTVEISDPEGRMPPQKKGPDTFYDFE